MIVSVVHAGDPLYGTDPGRHNHGMDATPQPQPATAGPPEPEAGGILTINLAALVANYRTLAARVVPSECAAVVKGDGYGCGIDQVTHALARAGCRTFFVAQLSEARRVRAVTPEAAIYVLNGYAAGAGQSFIDIYARPVINSTVELAEWDHFVASTGWTGGAGLHVDTGMNRLGLTVDEIAAVAPRMNTENHGVRLLMSHFACADRPEHPLNDRQIREFREVRTLFRDVPSSLANSSGIFLDSSAYCNLVRPGAALFGVNPQPGRPNPMQPIIELKARVLQVRSVPTASSAGYGATWTARKPSRIAVISAGYADGILRSADRNIAREVMVAGRRAPIVGRISMDLMAVDVTKLPEGSVRRSDMVTLIGDGLSIDEVAAQAGTIGYEQLTNLGRRYHRVWKS